MAEEKKDRREIEHAENLPSNIAGQFDRQAISIKSRKCLDVLLAENPKLKEILMLSGSPSEVMNKMYEWITPMVENDEIARKYYHGEIFGRIAFNNLSFAHIAAIRILDYLDHTGKRYVDLNVKGEKIDSDPFRILWLAARYGRGGAHSNFFVDMVHLFRQLSGKTVPMNVTEELISEWMQRHPSGLDPEIVAIRKKNKERIIELFIDKMDSGEIDDRKFFFEPGLSRQEKREVMNRWWDNHLFHLRFAIRSPERLNEMLDHSLNRETLAILKAGEEKGIPVFVNPYYLSLLIINPSSRLAAADQPIRDYIFYSKELLDEFGEIVAWEKEDIVEPGKPNAAGWLIPSDRNIHRRYPDVAILIPDTIGRSCGGLCVSCQRMYDFQSGNLNFDIERLKPQQPWWEKLEDLMVYFENDSQLCDILITGGDALMSSNNSLQQIFDAIYRMAARKRQANEQRPDGKKYAEITRIRLGTRLAVYLPSRITEELVEILKEFRKKAIGIGIRQFVIQTHFETAMEITPEAKKAIDMIISSGWIITNQQVFIASAARRGHTAKLRKVLNDVGVLPYYTFSVKGYMENYHNFATNARAIQEQMEEKVFGKVPAELFDEIRDMAEDAPRMAKNIKKLRSRARIPFLATDRNVINMPGVGKSLTFRTIGITRYGRRILEFDHDRTRSHSPIIDQMGKVIIVESKPINEFLKQMYDIGENTEEYRGIFGYSMGFTEIRNPVFKYPKRNYEITDELTNFAVDETTG